MSELVVSGRRLVVLDELGEVRGERERGVGVVGLGERGGSVVLVEEFGELGKESSRGRFEGLLRLVSLGR